jgi:hypothetical protein
MISSRSVIWPALAAALFGGSTPLIKLLAGELPPLLLAGLLYLGTHAHIHDEHHQHDHDFAWDGTEPHDHTHAHSATTHQHPHFPDSHHRHAHPG